MKIIYKGITPSEREYRCACHSCKTVFEFKQSEGKYNSDQRDGDFISIDCPTCNQYTTINASSYIKTPSVDPY